MNTILDQALNKEVTVAEDVDRPGRMTLARKIGSDRAYAILISSVGYTLRHRLFKGADAYQQAVNAATEWIKE